MTFKPMDVLRFIWNHWNILSFGLGVSLCLASLILTLWTASEEKKKGNNAAYATAPVIYFTLTFFIGVLIDAIAWKIGDKPFTWCGCLGRNREFWGVEGFRRFIKPLQFLLSLGGLIISIYDFSDLSKVQKWKGEGVDIKAKVGFGLGIAGVTIEGLCLVELFCRWYMEHRQIQLATMSDNHYARYTKRTGRNAPNDREARHDGDQAGQSGREGHELSDLNVG